MTVRDESERCSRSIGIGVRDRPEYANKSEGMKKELKNLKKKEGIFQLFLIGYFILN